MSLLEIPVQPTGTETHHTAVVVLDGVPYSLTFYTNTTDGRWYLDFDAQDGRSIVRGLALVLGVDLLHPYRHLDTVPPGWLFVADLGELAGADPGLTSFADGVAAVCYLEAG